MTEGLAEFQLEDLGKVTLHRGDIVAITGPNGCGKTSLLRALAGLPAPRPPGGVAIQGHDPATWSAETVANAVNCAFTEPRDTLIGLTVRGEFRLRDLPLPDPLRLLGDRDVATLSTGEARRVSLATATARTKTLLLLDEPSEGLDAQGRELLAQAIRRAATSGAVLFASHDPDLRALATRTIALAPDFVSDDVERPPAGGALVLIAEPRLVQRGATRVATPRLHLPAGLHALQGPNGAGKSTILLRIAGLLGAQGVTVAGQPPRPGRNVRLLLPRVKDLFTRESVADELADCADLGLVPAALLPRHPLTLSAGEAQRVALTKVLGRPAPLYGLDEPEAHLDGHARAMLLRILASKVRDGACIVLATQDARLAAWCPTRIEVRA